MIQRFLILLILLPMLGAVQSGDPQTAFDEHTHNQLAALTPSEPRSYFRLGEELAVDPRTRKLARELHALAYELARIGGDPNLASSAAVALADLTETPAEQRQLRAIAIQLDPRRARPAWTIARSSDTHNPEQIDAANALAELIAGRGHRVRDLLRTDTVRRVIDESPELIAITSPREPSEWLLERAKGWPCRECHNAGWVVHKERGQVRRELCPECSGDPGPALTRDQLAALIRAQARLLGGGRTSWSAQLDTRGPVRDPDPALMAVQLGVDARRSVWRDGRWTTP